ncbi:MAG: undecaprenyl-phosphate glucose phosphotransferase [Pirellulales bacterium]|nr:undecaprenyl-phosphate glucose phosphotransferase [Pirellulales bacterium]
MYRRHGQKLAHVFLLVDLAVTVAAWLAAYALRFGLVASPEGIPRFELVVAGIPFVLVSAAVAYRAAGLYEIHRLRELPRELGVVCRASGLLFLITIAVTFFRRDLYESRLALLLFPALNVLGMAVARRAVWQVLKRLRRNGLNYGRAVIVGVGRTGRRVARTIERHDWTGLDAVGFVDDQLAPVESNVLPRLGTIDRLGQIVAEHDIDHVFVALPLARYGELPRIYRELAGTFVEVQLVPDVPQLTGMRIRTLEIDDVAFLSLLESPHRGWHRVAKRSVDLAVGLAAIVLLAPLMALVALLVKLTSTGPVFYRQARVGQGGRTFHMLKFRSMRLDAEATTGPVWATRDDDRTTRVGRVLRRWSLDELPQLFNVLAGDMSLVGPRPERDTFIERFRRELPGYTQRHRVKAGMTGWAQVNGWRGNTSLRRRLEFDLYYVANWSLLLDLKILWLTPWRGLRHRHAY